MRPEDQLSEHALLRGERDELKRVVERLEADLKDTKSLTVDVLCDAAESLVALCCSARSIVEIVPVVQPRVDALRSAAMAVEPVDDALQAQLVKARDALADAQDMVDTVNDAVAENGAAQAAVTTGRIAELEAELDDVHELLDELRLFQAKAERMAELRIRTENKVELARSVKEFIQGWVTVGNALRTFDARQPALYSVHESCREEIAILNGECDRLKTSVARYKSLAEGSILESVSQKLADGLGDAEHPYGPQWERAGSRCVNCGHLGPTESCACPDEAVTQLWAIRRA
jgi:hypothetical protein